MQESERLQLSWAQRVVALHLDKSPSPIRVSRNNVRFRGRRSFFSALSENGAAAVESITINAGTGKCIARKHSLETSRLFLSLTFELLEMEQ
jgi:hypothetical protein